MDSGLSAPVKILETDWNDETRMNVLFSPFRKKEVNPVHWESKMKLWHSAFENWCFERNDSVISVKKMQQVFKRKGRLPMCFPTVIEHLLRTGEIKEKEAFQATLPQQSWSNWLVTSLGKIPSAIWSFAKLRDALPTVDNSEIQYVLFNYLKEVGNKLLTYEKVQKNTLLCLEDLVDILNEKHPGLSHETCTYIIQWLQIEKKVFVVPFEGKIVVKFSGNKMPPEDISQADIALFTLRQNRQGLVKNMESLEKEKEEILEEARRCIQKGMRDQAKSCLRRKKELEKCIVKRRVALDNTEILLSRISEAKTDALILDAYRMGLSALKATFKNAGLTEDSVINTMSEVHEAIDVHNEIQEAMSETITTEVDNELEEELAQLITVRPVVKKGQERVKGTVLPDLPNVPDEEFSSTYEPSLSNSRDENKKDLAMRKKCIAE